EGKDNVYFKDTTGREIKKYAIDKKDIKDSVQERSSRSIKVGDSEVSFAEASGQALLIEDTAPLPEGAVSNGYTLVLGEDAPDEVKISMNVEAPDKDVTTRIKIGLPYVDKNGTEDFLWVPLDTERSGSKVEATADLSEYDGIVEDFMFNGSASFDDDKLDFAKRSMIIADANTKGIKYAVRYFSENVYTILSPGKKFQINLPETYYRSDAKEKKGKLDSDDLKRLGEDMEALLEDYKEDFTKDTRTKWPIQVEDCNYKDAVGGYGGGLTQNSCLLYLKFGSLSNGYKRNDTYDGSSNSMYHLLAHELFHFIQWEYTNKSLRSLWFDEATAVYYEDEKGDAAGEYGGNNYNIDALNQYNGITPATTFLRLNEAAESDGYGRKALIEYLVKTFGDDFMPKLMPNYTVRSSGKPVEDMITKQTGKTMAELTRDYYDCLVGKGELKGVYTEPWEFCMGKYGGYRERLPEYVCTRMDITGTGKNKFSFPLPRYGVHFIILAPKNLPAKYESFNVELDTPDTSAILFDIDGDEYDDISVYRSWDEGLEANYIEGHSYLLMVINESDTHYGGGMLGSTASISVTLNDMNEDNSGSYPTKAEQVPKEFEGYITRRVMIQRGSLYEYRYETVSGIVKLSLNDQTGTLSVTLTDDEGIEYYKENLKYNSQTGQGTGKEGTLQFERGDYDTEGEVMIVRLHDNFSDGYIFQVFEGYGDTVAEKKEEKPVKTDYSGSYRTDEEDDEYSGFGVTGFRTAFNNAFNNVTISMSKDGSFSGSGSYSASDNRTDPWNTPGTSKGSVTRQESVNASVSISGKIGEDGKGTYTVTGTASLTGRGNGTAKSDDPSASYYAEATLSEEWKYSYSLSVKDTAEMTEWENSKGKYVPALFLSFDQPVKVTGSYTEKEDIVHPNTILIEDTHYTDTDPVNKDWAYSGLFIYLK
nr:hypothetical protein [Lachnospiraceae bacterium]